MTFNARLAPPNMLERLKDLSSTSLNIREKERVVPLWGYFESEGHEFDSSDVKILDTDSR